MRRVLTLGVMLSLLTMAMATHAQTLRVAAASDLQYAMLELVAPFEKQSGIKIVASYGSSGNFRSQIQNGAPFDLFFSADVEFPKQLVTNGFADADTLTVYAHGHLVLWASTEGRLDLSHRGFEALKDPRVKRIAIANPELAPYGRAAISALKSAGVYEAVKAKLIFGENISQTAQFTQSGNAQVGILARSLVSADSMKNGEVWDVPANLYPVIEQAVVVMHASANKKAALAFLEFVKSPSGRQILSNHGLSLDVGGPKP